MDLFELLTNFSITETQIWGVVKVFYLLGILMYIVFAFVVTRQTKMMINALNGALELPIKFASRVHLLVSVLVWVIAFFVL